MRRIVLTTDSPDEWIHTVYTVLGVHTPNVSSHLFFFGCIKSSNGEFPLEQNMFTRDEHIACLSGPSH